MSRSTERRPGNRNESGIRPRVHLAGKRLVLVLSILLAAGALAGIAYADSVDNEVAQIRADIQAHGYSWTAGRTSVMELPLAERRALCGVKLPPGATGRLTDWQRTYRPQPGTFPSYFSWFDQGIMTPIRDQGGCGSCWAFAAVGCVEAHIKQITHLDQDLSEQQMVSCTDGSCAGGWMDSAYNLMIGYGAVSETCMPYEASDAPLCIQGSCQVVDKIQGFYPTGDDVASIKAALLLAPVSTTFTVYDDFYGYSGGCYEHPGNDPINHAVVICGWDDSACNGIGAWLCKNSWGPGFGLQGYFWIEYGSANIGYCTEQVDYTPLHPVVLFHTPLQDTNDSQHDYAVRTDISAYVAPVASASLYYRVNGGLYNNVNLANAGGQTWSGSIPHQPVGATIDYYLEATDTAGHTAYYPPQGNGACDTFHVVFFVVQDPCESQGWWVCGVPGDDAVTGKWELGVPQGTWYNGAPVQADSDATSGSGTKCFVTGAAAGVGYWDNDVSGGTTTLLSPVYDLTGHLTARVAFDLWYINQVGPSPVDDAFKVDVSNDAGAHWVRMYTQTSGTLPGEWNRVSFSIADFVPLTSQVRFRFLASDGGTADIVEAAVDNFSISSMEYPTAVPPEPARAQVLALAPPVPNPTTGGSTLEFSLPATSPVELGLYSPGGRLEISLWSGTAAAGSHRVSWDGRGRGGKSLPSGIYYLRLRTATGERTERITLIR